MTEEVTRRTQAGGGPSGNTPIVTEAPVVSVRQAQTVARVRDGQTIVIAGLIRERKRNIDTGIPALMEIPVLGYLFHLTEEVKEKSELVILITPKLVGNHRYWTCPGGSGTKPGSPEEETFG